MLLRKFLITGFMVAYIYTLSFGIFMTQIFRIPAPLVLCLPLVLFFREAKSPFLYGKEAMLFFFALFLYDYVGMADHLGFFASLIVVTCCILYFNYFVGDNIFRFKLSMWIFYALLFFSAIIMVLNHFLPARIDQLRGTLLNDTILQSPAGLALTQFNYGYQLAALVSFLFVITQVFRLNIVLKVLAFIVCIIFIYLGMNRSVFVTFLSSAFLFVVFYYRYKSIFIISAAVLIGFISYSFIIKENFDAKNNILAKNEGKGANYYNRVGMSEENLKIYADYPFGLIFYGKNWRDVTYRNSTFNTGLTSHNAYLMFFTYLGPFLGLGLLLFLYYRVGKIFFGVLFKIRRKENALLIGLCFSFLGVSINAFSHNGWLVSADGPTLFLYFSILHLVKIQEFKRVQQPIDITAERYDPEPNGLRYDTGAAEGNYRLGYSKLG
ncbi:hypothetical protein [Pedobacter gandavensis]|uniref:hypothetical protein n=1 Tax=Pedobacter gandavensis TaxID=2679963 RepID=UPI0016032C7F|nr:hypothetical protein [Pedobacter gandavensis]